MAKALLDKLVAKEAGLGVVHHAQSLAETALKAVEKIAVLCTAGLKLWSSWAVSTFFFPDVQSTAIFSAAFNAVLARGCAWCITPQPASLATKLRSGHTAKHATGLRHGQAQHTLLHLPCIPV